MPKTANDSTGSIVDPSVLAILRCPQDHSELTQADPRFIERANQAIRAGRVTTVAGQPVQNPLDGGLLRAAGDLLYPIIEGIPVLLHDEAIEVRKLGEP